MTQCSSIDPATGKRCKWPAEHDGLHSADLGHGKAQHWGTISQAEIDRQVEAWRREAQGG
jgi:hypothetical protein